MPSPIVNTSHALHCEYPFPSPQKVQPNFLMSTLENITGLACPFTIPNKDAPLTDSFVRFSEAYVQHPRLIVAPKTEEHVVAATQFARSNKLGIVVGGGGHGTYVSIGPDTMYVDMSAFRTVELDKEAGCVCFGGGVLTGQLLKSLAKDGYYTTVPNSNAVGAVGAILGGGNSVYNGIHGYMADNVVQLRVATAAGRVVGVSSSSTGDELALFNVLCGAGHGLGIVLSVTMAIYPIKPLGLTDDKIWARTFYFASPALADVARAFASFNPPERNLNVQLAFARGRTGTPFQGKPIIVLSALYFGPTQAAEQAASAMLTPGVAEQASLVDATPLAFENTNDALEKLYAHGGARSTNGCRVKSISASTVEAIFNAWVAYTNGAEQATAVLQNFNPSQLIANGQDAKKQVLFVECRDRPFTMVLSMFCTSQAALGLANDTFVNDLLAIARRGDGDLTPRTIPNTMKFNQDVSEMFSAERLVEMQRVKQAWDSDHVFWLPYKF